MTGWIRTQRDIFSHHLWDGDPFSNREAWLWLIANAAWADTRHRVGKKTLPVERGSLFISLRKLAEKWKWKSDYKVRSYLEVLQKEEMILINATHGKTYITICNYDVYQILSTDENAKTNAKATHLQRTKETNKQNNKGYRPSKKNVFGISSMASQWAEEIREKKHG